MQPHEELLFLADDDLNAAKDLLVTKRMNAGIYHTQQAAEKAFKAYLSFKKQPLVKTHNLAVLYSACLVFDVDFNSIALDAADLNGLDTAFRYNDGPRLIPTQVEFENAILLAETIFNFVKTKIV